MSTISIPRLFGFKRIKVNYAKALDESTAGVSVSPDKRYSLICSVCDKTVKKIHMHRERVVRDIPLGIFRKVYVNIHYRLVKCTHCNKIHVEASDVTDVGGPRVTKRMARLIQFLCETHTVTEVADLLQLDWKTVKNIDKAGLKEDYGETDYTGLRILAIDEIAYSKHHKYLTIVMDYETGRVMWTGEGRKADTLREFFNGMPEEVRQGIEAVAMDMWPAYAKVVEEACPQAAIVYDLFHIVAKYNRVIDDVRREEIAKAKKEDKPVISGSRWILLKNRDNLKDSELPRLEELLAVNENLAKVYILKDDLKVIWKYDERELMAQALTDWCTRAIEAELPSLNRFVRLIERHWEGILNHACHPISNGRLEGTNNKIKVIKRESYGFHDLEYFQLKIKQRCSGKQEKGQHLRR